MFAGNVGKTALYLASELNQLDTAHQLLQVPECDIRKSDSNGMFCACASLQT